MWSLPARHYIRILLTNINELNVNAVIIIVDSRNQAERATLGRHTSRRRVASRQNWPEASLGNIPQSPPGMTIVMVTHERSLAEKFADRLAIMGDGKPLSTPLAQGVEQ
jgi:hypothetical protein